jgi:hypothetical protein
MTQVESLQVMYLRVRAMSHELRVMNHQSYCTSQERSQYESSMKEKEMGSMTVIRLP